MSIITEFHDCDIHFPSGTIWFGPEVDDSTVQRAIKNIMMLERAGKDITVILANHGGDIFHGLALFDVIKGCRVHVTGKVYGMAESMAADLLQACDLRLMAPNSHIMIHVGEIGFGDMHPRILKRWLEHDNKVAKRLEDIYLERIREKHPAFTRKMLQHRLEFDTIYTAEEAVEVGLADGILRP